MLVYIVTKEIQVYIVTKEIQVYNVTKEIQVYIVTTEIQVYNVSQQTSILVYILDCVNSRACRAIWEMFVYSLMRRSQGTLKSCNEAKVSYRHAR